MSSEPTPPQYPTAIREHGDAFAVGYRDHVLALICESAHPPGRPLRLTLGLPSGELRLEGKSSGSKRREDGRFDVRVKLSSVRKEQRAALETAFAAA
jgi:hypothetical protein